MARRPTNTPMVDPPIGSMNDDELQRAHKAAEIQKTLAEAEKLRAEAGDTQAPWKHLWQRPAAWAALLPGLATIGTAFYAINNGFLDARQETIKAEDKIVIAKRSELNAEVTKLQAEKALLEAQKTSLQGSIDSDRKLLELKNEILRTDQADFTKRKTVFEDEKSKLAEQISSLTKQRDTLDNAVKQAAITVPLDAIFSDERKAWEGYNANYSAILQALKRAPTSENIAIVSGRLDRAQTAPVKALLYRTLYLATGNADYFEKLMEIPKSSWKDAPRGFWEIFAGYDIEWSDPDRVTLFRLLTEVFHAATSAGSFQTATYISDAVLRLCEWKCSNAIDQESKLTAATYARNNVVAFKSDGYFERRYPLRLIYWVNQHAGRLLLAHLWRDDNGEQITSRDSTLFLESRRQDGRGEDPAPALVDQPKSGDKAVWLAWLDGHKADLDAVLALPASKWPGAMRQAANETVK